MASVSILSIEPAELVAPVGVWFEAVDIADFEAAGGPAPDEVYDPSAHEITWEWDFSDPGAFATALNIPTLWNEKGKDYGKKAYHVFDTPGIYQVRLKGTQAKADGSGMIEGEATKTITVLDPNDVYVGIRTICVSNKGDFTGAPSNARQVGSLIEGFAALRSLQRTGRILLRAGEVFDEGKTLQIEDPMVNFRLGAFGSGPPPILRRTNLPTNAGVTSILSFRNRNQVQDTVFYGLRFEGEWDATKEVGDPRLHAVNHDTHNSIAHTSMFFQCEFSGLSLYLFTDWSGGYTHGVVDCDITNWPDYGILTGKGYYHPHQRLAIVGSAIHQSQDACKGAYGKHARGICNQHGPFRYSDVMNVILSASDFYSANSWPSDGGIQPTLRMASSINGPGGQYIGANRIVCEGGSAFYGIDALDAFVELPGNHVFDKFLILGDYRTQNGAIVTAGGTTHRNGLMVLMDMNYQTTTPQFLTFTDNQSNPGAGNRSAPMRFHNLTFLNLTGAQVAPFAGDEVYSAFIAENNILHAPAVGGTGFAPIGISGTIAGVSPRNRGERLGPEKVTVVLDASVSGSGGSVTVPYPAGTSAADFSPGGRHQAVIDFDYYFREYGHCSFVFGPGGVTVTNSSGVTWNPGQTLRLMLDQDTLTTDGTFASPASVPLPVPEGDSPALANDGGALSLTRFDATARRGAPWKGAV